MAATALLLIAVAVACGRGKIFWEDEMLGWMMLRDPSLGHMLWSWRQGADGGGISFYLLGRLWLRAFGTSMVAYRMFSTCCFAAAMMITWSVMRRYYTTAAIAFSSLVMWLVSPFFVDQITTGRFYGMLEAASAAAIWMAVYCYRRDYVHKAVYAAVFLTHALLTTTHQLGVLYSFFLVVAMAALDAIEGCWRPRLYLSAAAAWLLLIPSMPAIRASAMVGKPYFWTEQPSFGEFVLLYTGFTHPIEFLVLALLASLCIVGLLHRDLVTRITTAYKQRTPLYVIAGALFLVPFALLIEGVVGPPLCVNRYVQPVALATIFLLAEIVTLLLPYLDSYRSRITSGAWADTPLLRKLSVGGWTIFVGALLVYDFGYRPHHTMLSTDYTPGLASQLPGGIPVVCEDAFTFTELISRQHDSGIKFMYLLDWENSLSPHVAKLEVTQFHLMENWKKVGYFSGSIEYAGKFFSQTPEFDTLSINEVQKKRGLHTRETSERLSEIGSDLHRRLAADPRYRVSLTKVIDFDKISVYVWHVCRKGSACDRYGTELPTQNVSLLGH